MPADTASLREREAELATLEELAAAAAEGRGRLVLIEGPAGIGKSGARRPPAGSARVATS